VYDEYGVQQVAPKYRDVPEHPDAIACDPKTGSLYIASFEGGVTVYSVTGQKIKAPFANTQRPQGILVDTHDGLVYVSNGIGSPVITAYTTAGVQVQTTGDWAGTPNPYGLAFDAQTNLIYVTDFGTGRVTAYDEQGRRHKLTGFSGMTPALGIGPIAIIE
jgi:DNA-binding beta-propeller fold protein YncE